MRTAIGQPARLLIACVPLALAAASCELVLPLDGYAGDGSADATGPREEAGQDAARDATTDRPFEASSRDQGAVDTGGSDAGDFCAVAKPGYRLCSDFDLEGGVTQGFDVGLVTSGSGGSFTLSSSTFFSAPRGAIGVSDPFDSGQTSGAVLVGALWSTGPAPATLTCELEWKPIAVSTVSNDYAHVLEIAVYSDVSETDLIRGLGITMTGAGAVQFVDYSPSAPSKSVEKTFPLSVKLGTWLAVRVTLGGSGSLGGYQASVGGVVLSGAGLNSMPAVSYGEAQIGPARLQGSTVVASPGWTFAYDNVLCY